MSVSKSILTIQSAANIAKLLPTLPTKPGHQVVVGRLYGMAVDTINRANPVGEPHVGFAGQFELEPAFRDEAVGGEKEDMRSSNLFLPDGPRDAVKSVLEKMLYPNPEKPDKKARGVSVSFACEILIVVGDKGAFQWGVRMLQEPRADDPLANLKASIMPPTEAKAPQAVEAPGKAADAKSKKQRQDEQDEPPGSLPAVSF